MAGPSWFVACKSASPGSEVPWQVQKWDLKTRALRKEVKVDSDWVAQSVLVTDGIHVYAEGDNFEGLVLRVDLETGGVDTVFAPDRVDPPLKQRGGAFDARPVAIGPDGNDLVIRSLPDALVWNLKTGARRFSCTLTGHPACAAVFPDGRNWRFQACRCWISVPVND